MENKRPKEGSIMKIFRLVTSFLILGIILVAVPAIAGQVKTGSSYGLYQTGQGGEFTLQTLSDDMLQVLQNGYVGITSTANTFQTFCLEHNEYIYTNTTYDVTISNSAKNGGLGGATNGADPISAGTAWLYRSFATGSLSGYNYTDTAARKTSAGLLQNTFWWLEGEGLGYNSNNPFMSAVVAEFGEVNGNGWSAAMNDANGKYGVGVVNMTLVGGGRAQDQLVLTAVPEPSALLFLGITLVGVAIAVRRFNKVQA
jgi:hypothetical protein